MRVGIGWILVVDVTHLCVQVGDAPAPVEQLDPVAVQDTLRCERLQPEPCRRLIAEQCCGWRSRDRHSVFSRESGIESIQAVVVGFVRRGVLSGRSAAIIRFAGDPENCDGQDRNGQNTLGQRSWMGESSHHRLLSVSPVSGVLDTAGHVDVSPWSLDHGMRKSKTIAESRGEDTSWCGRGRGGDVGRVGGPAGWRRGRRATRLPVECLGRYALAKHLQKRVSSWHASRCWRRSGC